MKLSLVIPVYNEESSIGDCLESVARQQRQFDECVVVDNRCSDSTMDIVREYQNRIPLKLVYESRPGVVWAREVGFEVATGDILCRIDADTRLGPQWSRRVEEFFEKHSDYSAVTGINYTYDTPIDGYVERSVKSAAAKSIRNGATATETLCGNNMAIRADSWSDARKFLLNAPNTHEDVDLSLALAKAGGRSALFPALVGVASGRRFAEPLIDNVRYLYANYRTARMHGDWGVLFRMLLLAPVNIVFLLVMKVLVAPFDPDSRAWRPFRSVRKRRVSPVTGVRR
ncbi:glycosyltransferase [Gordonia hydrophobica]|uniref:Glycosyltransferase family 2 protein n=1 Tax=Gordonia hydrophobica TaxID=40516 RepID=A0ABZ2TWM3_9ACTN|nr:glycosyltransferase family 2 protein [Gordonia hydrophobica]MBM7369297.1 glycosyltransferase involved in cell wall biosynthesis [Gordonia hydrophobica]